ncbi:hypothetical protein AN958_05766 [Leucoagaricus sp. SymC.cos]|nr:hypothetical protein AN958_05766 [Leucoagaricus sp. SymC.cos]
MPGIVLIPFELIISVIGACSSDLATLCTWSLVSRVCLSEARKHLYQDITFTPDLHNLLYPGGRKESDDDLRCLGMARAYRFLHAVISNPQLATLVQQVTVAFHEGIWSASMWITFRHAFIKMSELKCFRLNLNYYFLASTTILASLDGLFDGHTMRLKELSISLLNAPAQQFLFLPRMLQLQPELEELYLLGSSWDGVGMEAGMCPSLHTISTWSRRCIEIIVPSRPVVKLCWDLSKPQLYQLDSNLNCSNFTLLAQTLSKIRILVLQGPEDHGRWLLFLSPYLTSVEVLDMQSCSERDAGGLVHLDKLRVIICRAEADIQRQKSLVDQWFLLSATLKATFFHTESSTQPFKWTKGAGTPVSVDPLEILQLLMVKNLTKTDDGAGGN